MSGGMYADAESPMSASARSEEGARNLLTMLREEMLMQEAQVEILQRKVYEHHYELIELQKLTKARSESCEVPEMLSARISSLEKQQQQCQCAIQKKREKLEAAKGMFNKNMCLLTEIEASSRKSSARSESSFRPSFRCTRESRRAASEREAFPPENIALHMSELTVSVQSCSDESAQSSSNRASQSTPPARGAIDSTKANSGRNSALARKLFRLQVSVGHYIGVGVSAK